MTMTANGHPADTKTRPTWPALTALAGATLLASLGISIASVALPTLAAAFSASIQGVQWAVLAYLISVTVTIMTAGWLGDIYGHHRVLVAGLGVFAVSSVLCAAAPTLGALVAGRAVQGIGGAILMALPLSIARDTVAKDRLGTTMGLFGTMSAVGTALGPSLGGLLIAGFGWRSAFALLAGVAVLLIGVGIATIPAAPARGRNGKTHLDWPGAALLGAALLAYAAAMAGWNAGLLLPLAILASAAFFLVERRSKAPLVSLEILLDRASWTALAMNVLVATVMMSTLVVGPFFLTFALRLDVALVGMVMAVGPVIAALSGIPAGRATDRFGAQRVLVAGLFTIFVGLVGLAALPRWFGVAGYVAALAILTPGFQLFLAANNTAVMMAAPENKRGTMSALLGLSRNLGFMTGASAMAAVFALAAGTGEAGNLAADHAASAFTITFLVAAGLVPIALVFAATGRGTHER
jgi:MFS family permease